ncbi:MAG: hypothetical protein ACI97A_003100 [Planctomycetota bacterium]|jgi:hypothetical protein
MDNPQPVHAEDRIGAKIEGILKSTRPVMLLSWYQDNIVREWIMAKKEFQVERVQTGMRVERRILKVLKGLAEYYDMSLGDLIEGIVLHNFEGKVPFGAESLAVIADLKKVYKLDLDANASHRLIE